jgi:hypothetical protein
MDISHKICRFDSLPFLNELDQGQMLIIIHLPHFSAPILLAEFE